MRILFLTVMPSPFLHAIVTAVTAYDGSFIIDGCFYGQLTERPTWGASHWTGVTLSQNPGDAKKELSAIIASRIYDGVIISGYSHAIEWHARHECIRLGMPFFVGPMEPPRPRAFWRQTARAFILRRFLRGARGVLTMGRTGHQVFSRLFDGPIEDVPYAFDLSEMLGAPRYRDTVSALAPVRFLYSGRLVAFRDPLFCLRCFRTFLKTTRHDAQLVISGRGVLEEAVDAYIKAHDLVRHVVYMNDFRDWYELRLLYQHADILLSLGVYNTWSLTVQEAMAAGMGVIATRTTEAANTLIIDGHNGFLVNHGRVDDTVAAMTRYVSSPSLLAEHGQRNRAVAQTVDSRAIGTRLAQFLSNHMHG
jgi:glycosyltransferase involved in cell wall biosynthesis